MDLKSEFLKTEIFVGKYRAILPLSNGTSLSFLSAFVAEISRFESGYVNKASFEKSAV